MTLPPQGSIPLTDEEIVDHYQSGSLLQELLHPDTSRRSVLESQLATLHNAGSIDLLALTAAPEFEGIAGWHFFSIVQAYCAIIPLLEAESLAMLEMVQRLMAHGGGQAMAPMAAGALSVWLSQKSERAKDIVELGKANSLIDLEILRGALVASGDVGVIMSFIDIPDPRRRAAIAALGGIKPLNEPAGDAAFATLLAIAANEGDENIRFTAIFTSFNLLKFCEPKAPQWVLALVNAVRARPSDATRKALLQGLFQQAALFQAAEAGTTLTLAAEGDLSSDELRTQLSITLCRLIGGTHHDLAIDCATMLFSTTGKAMPLDDALEHGLMTMDRRRLFDLAVRWFATGDPSLCDVVAKLAGGTQQSPPFDASLAGYDLSGSQMLVLCHKAVGYMIMAPVVAASFVVAALRAGDRKLGPQLEQLLLQALLINYGGTVAAYLKTMSKTDAAYRSVNKALKLYRKYEHGVNNVPPIKELSPSSYQRGVVRQNAYVMNQEISEQAHRKSVFFGLVHRSTLLYGRRAQTYMGGADKPPHSMEMKSYSTSFEMPTLHVVDPVGLDWLMRIFMSSKPK